MQVYKTINKITGQFYIGLNRTSDPEYLGSGTNISNQILKYGRENFSKEILCELNENDDRILMKIESLFIRKYIDDEKCLNIARGYKDENNVVKIKYVEKIKYVKEMVVVKDGRSLAALLRL